MPKNNFSIVMAKSFIDKWSEGTRKAMMHGTNTVTTWHHKFLKPEHVLLGVLIIEDGEASSLLKDQGIDPLKLSDLLISSFKMGKRKYAAPAAGTEHHIRYAKNTVKAMTYAKEEYIRKRAREMQPVHILMGLMKLNYPPIKKLMKVSAIKTNK